MSELLDKFNAGQLIGLTAVMIGPLIAIVAIITGGWRSVRVAELEASLKQQMLDKGMSAADIEQVMQANQKSSRSGKVVPTGTGSIDKAALAHSMVENGYEAGDIERVLLAYQQTANEKNLA